MKPLPVQKKIQRLPHVDRARALHAAGHLVTGQFGKNQGLVAERLGQQDRRGKAVGLLRGQTVTDRDDVLGADTERHRPAGLQAIESGRIEVDRLARGDFDRRHPATMEELMRKRRAEAAAAYEACWDGGKGSHHPDFDPAALAEAEAGGGVPGGGPPPARRASRPTEELYNAIVSDDVAAVYAALEAGADAGWEFGSAYRTAEGYTPLMVAAHRCVCFCVCVCGWWWWLWWWWGGLN